MVTVGCCKTRDILWMLVFLGCGINYMIRTNINIAIVSMIKNRNISANVSLASQLVEMNEDIQANNSTYINNLSSTSAEEFSTFEWDEHQQGMILGGFFWTYWLGQIPGGVLANKYGCKIVFGFSNAFICITTYLIPWFSSLDYKSLIALRMVQGLIGGLSWPALHCLASKWIPPNERGKFFSAYMGSGVGAALTYPVCGYIIYIANWQAVFYVTASVGLIWFISWWYLIYDTPSQHPRISVEECKYIESSVKSGLSKQKLPIPWIKIFLSGPLWITILAEWGCLWGMFTLLVQAPTYFQNIHGWDIRTTGFLSGVPQLIKVLFSLALSYTFDHLLTIGYLSNTAVRKIASQICCTIQGLFILALAFTGSNSTSAIICLTLAVVMTGAEASGPLAAYVDLSPNFASIVMGLGNMVTVIPGFISPAIVGYFTYQNQTSEQWQIIYFISAAMLIIPGLINLCFGSSEIQKWNFPPEAYLEHTQQTVYKMVSEEATDQSSSQLSRNH